MWASDGNADPGLVVSDLPSVLAEIEAVLREPPEPGDAALARIEATLTDGYAHALELEAERWRLERRIGELARTVVPHVAADHAEELSELSDRLAGADADLRHLRTRLDELRRRADAARAA